MCNHCTGSNHCQLPLTSPTVGHNHRQDYVFYFSLWQRAVCRERLFEVDEGRRNIVYPDAPDAVVTEDFIITQTGRRLLASPALHLSLRCNVTTGPPQPLQERGLQNRRRIMNATPSWQLALLWERPGRTLLAQTLAANARTSSINQTIKGEGSKVSVESDLWAPLKKRSFQAKHTSLYKFKPQHLQTIHFGYT